MCFCFGYDRGLYISCTYLVRFVEIYYLSRELITQAAVIGRCADVLLICRLYC